MKELLFNQNYQNEKFNIEFLYKKNFTLFRIKNFLDESSYQFLKKSFPEIDSKRLSNSNLEKRNYKYTIISTDRDYENMLKKNENLKIIHDSFFSKKFYNYFYKNLKVEFLKSRSDDLKFFFKLLKPKTLDFSGSNVKNFFFTYIRRQIEYSFIFNNGKIVPHTDGRSKLLSLLMFFPEGLDGEKEIGTTFWESNIKNLNNEHLKNNEREKKFKENNKILTKLPFSKYDLYGFIRNSKSWHSVEPFYLGKDYIRRSININFYF